MSFWDTAWAQVISWRESVLRTIEDRYSLRLPSSVHRGTYSQPWPPMEDRPRLERYSRYLKIYEGKHEDVYVGSGQYSYDRPADEETGTTDSRRPYVVDNLLGEMTDLITQRLFGEPVEIVHATASDSTSAEKWLSDLRSRCDLDQVMLDLATGTAPRGDGILKVRYDSEQKGAVIEAVPPGMVRLRSRSGTIVAAAVEEVLRDGDQLYLLQEIHERGSIAYRLYTLRGKPGTELGYTPEKDRVALDTLEATADLPDEVATGVDELLVVHVAKGRGDERGLWGVSDYADDLDSLQGELNNRMTQRAEILDKHSDPWMYGPAQLIDDHGRLKLNPNERYIGVTNKDEIPGYLFWDAQLQAVENEIADVRQAMMRDAGVSPESLMDGEGGAESGRALKLRQVRTASTVRGDQRVYDKPWRQAISVASKLERAVGKRDTIVLEPDDIALRWGDGLPDDEMQQIEENGMEVSFGILSRRTAIEQRHPDWDETRVDEELARIDNDRGGVPAVGGGGRLGLADELEDVEETETA